MAKSLENLTLANATFVKEVALLRAELAANVSSHRSNPSPDSRFSKTGYCWSHGYKFSKTHTSDSCTKRKDGHKYKATSRNTMEDSDYNKGLVV